MFVWGFWGPHKWSFYIYIYIAYYCCLNHNESSFLRWNVWVIAVIAAISPLWSSGFTKNRTWRKRTCASCCNASSLGAAWRGGNLSWFFHGNLSPQFTVIQRWRRISTSCGHRRQPCIHNPQSATHVAPPTMMTNVKRLLQLHKTCRLLSSELQYIYIYISAILRRK